MAIIKVEMYECDICKKTFINPQDVRVFIGNVLTGDGGGLIGNNFDENGKVFKESMLCIKCVLDSLCLNEED